MCYPARIHPIYPEYRVNHNYQYQYQCQHTQADHFAGLDTHTHIYIFTSGGI